ncbi:MAG: 16S rRNA (guanine(966)-N(2))-methyltransferase RsmD [Mangrovicoccus sp.]|nr:16S rRNA (guanine(966)-N(2))-methyltransferase RsmD [Mangrovicoccus sp.]
MRIIAGEWRGLRLASVGKGDVAAHLRPTADRVRESLFNVLAGGAFGDPIAGAQVLDLFAGTGALGLEALSRGAAGAVFVENGRKSGAILAENLRLTRAGAVAQVLRRDATRLGACEGAPADLVFLDPPYGKDMGGKALAAARAGGWLAPGALILWEESTPQTAPDGFELLECRRYGDTHISFLERAA